MNTDKEMVDWLNFRMCDVKEAFKHANEMDKLNALITLQEATQRVFAVVEAQLAVHNKAYPANYIAPWHREEGK